MSVVAADELKKFAEQLLAKGGFTAREAKDIAESLTLSELLGHSSHGLMRIKEYLGDLKKGATRSGAHLKILQETPNSLQADAERGVGQTVMPLLLERMQKKLSDQAIVSASLRNSGHIGRIGEWVEKPALEGYPGLLLVNDNGVPLCVAPAGGKASVTSTNPIAFAIPLEDGEVFLADMSTSATAFGKVKLARLNKTSVPPNCIQDAKGQATTDPESLFRDPKGSILPMGGKEGYKGFALSMFIDLLVAGLSGGYAPPAPEGTLYANNLTLILWNPKFFAGLPHMQKEAKKYIDFVRASPPTDPSKPIRLPGDRMNDVKQKREQSGIPLGEGLIKDLLHLSEKFDVVPPSRLVNSK